MEPMTDSSSFHSFERQRLERQQELYQAEWETRTEKLKELRQSLAVTPYTSSSNKFQLEKEIQAEEAAIADLEQRLSQIEQKLQNLQDGCMISPMPNLPLDLEESDGPVPLSSPFYVERPPSEERCYQAITKPGALIRIKAPRQMGKSSLTSRILQNAETQGYRTSWLSIPSAGENLSSLDHFLKWFCERVTRKLDLPHRVDEHWQGVSGSLDKCTDYFEGCFLKGIQAPLVLGLDGIDRLFKHSNLYQDFFPLLRCWHEEAKLSQTNIWRNFRLVITYVEDIELPSNRSPFNVGVPIDLLPFTAEQLADLVRGHGLLWSVAEQAQLMAMVGGHPYLTRLALQQIAQGRMTLATFLQTAPTQAGLFASHLSYHHDVLEERKLVATMKQVIASPQPVKIDTRVATKLANLGLVKLQGNEVVPFCDLYRQYFPEVLA